MPEQKKYKMTISRLTVDKLGVKLYDRVSAVISELVANCYDADAKHVYVRAPMDEWLATKNNGNITDKGFKIEVEDDGIGMTPDEVNTFYLSVGSERRKDPKRGSKSKLFKRKVMGRKGVGKLAPFGVCEQIEIISSGGDKVDGPDEQGKQKNGYLTAHLILERSKIMEDTTSPYYPQIGELDGTIRQKTGTLLKLQNFDRRHVPSMDDFERQISQRFGIKSTNWNVILNDITKTETDPKHVRAIGEFCVEKMENTEIHLKIKPETQDGNNIKTDYHAIDSSGNQVDGIDAGFEFEGKFYPVVGWIAYSKFPYKDEIMAGVRVYCRGKIAAQTRIFNLRAGFTGEYDIRSYLVGELHADWLDEDEDLIRTDRQDILWSHELGQEFENWGQKLVKKIGVRAKEPQRKKLWTIFEELSKIHEKVGIEFPSDEQKDVRENTLEIAKAIAQTTQEEELKDKDLVDSLVNLSLLFGPYITLDRKLREAAADSKNPLAFIVGILKTARIAELAGFGKIVENRLKIIEKVESLKDDPITDEQTLQKLITESPWLVNPQWSPMTENQTFSTLKKEFEKFYKKRTGKEISLTEFKDPKKRADFVLSSQDNAIQIIEIKKSNHSLINEEMDRIDNYIKIMKEFLGMQGHEEFAREYSEFHVTLVCDKISLTGIQQTGFDSYKKDKILTHITWSIFLLRTSKMHHAFLDLAMRQKKDASK